MRVGIVSDTHGRLPHTVIALFEAEAVGHILHAGDVGGIDVLVELQAVAPVTAVLGNTDLHDYGGTLTPLANVALDGVRVLVVHRPEDVPHPLPEDVRVVVTGHTHRAAVERRDGVLHVNPGSPSRSRGGGHSVAILETAARAADARIVPLP